jgi:hypothetical protein
MQKLRRKRVFSPKQAKQQVLSADVLTRKPVSFLRCIKQHTLGNAAERKVYGTLNRLTDRSAFPEAPQPREVNRGSDALGLITLRKTPDYLIGLRPSLLPTCPTTPLAFPLNLGC